MTWTINQETLRDRLKMPTGRIYEAVEIGRNLPVGSEQVRAVVRVRIETQRNFAIALYVGPQQKVSLIDTRPDSLPLADDPFGSEDHRTIEHDIKDYYAHQVYRVPRAAYEQMMRYLRGNILADAFSLNDENQSKTARALGLARSVFQDHQRKYPLSDLNGGERFKAWLRIQPYEEMVDEFERFLLIDAMRSGENTKRHAAAQLEMPRQTLSERLRKLGISV